MTTQNGGHKLAGFLLGGPAGDQVATPTQIRQAAAAVALLAPEVAALIVAVAARFVTC